MKKLRKRQRRWIAAGAVLLALLAAALDARLLVRRYTVEFESIDAPVRVALITDLHSCRYGTEQRTLLEAIHGEAPDLVLLGGDLFDKDTDPVHTEQLLRGLQGRYPVYAVMGNHDLDDGDKADVEYRKELYDRYGVTLLSGQTAALTFRGQTVLLGGVQDPAGSKKKFDAQLEQLAEEMGDAPCSLLLSHRPEYYDRYRALGFDLVLCGHAHGGQWRIPGLLNGLYAPHQGLFPEHAGGIFREDGTTMIVSRGLARETTLVPRIFNRPELVILELT